MKFAVTISVLVFLALYHQTNSAPDPDASIQYSLWISQDGNVTASKRTLQVPLAKNSSFFQVMVKAAKLNPHYKFKATYYEKYKSHFITAIDGVKNNDASSHYWMYGTIQPPNDKLVEAKVGVDSFYPEAGDHVVFWYKKVDLNSGH